jgi:hypothetical protein
MALPLAVERLMSPQWEASQAKIVGTEVSKLVEVSTVTVASVSTRRMSGIAVKEMCNSRMQLIQKGATLFNRQGERAKLET